MYVCVLGGKQGMLLLRKWQMVSYTPPCAKQHWICVGTNSQCCRLQDNKLPYSQVSRNCCCLSLAAVPAAITCKCLLNIYFTGGEIRMNWPLLHLVNRPFSFWGNRSSTIFKQVFFCVRTVPIIPLSRGNYLLNIGQFSL